tara:strand:+ start:642 stop:1220 length:579 start_codon:yes stop_codon:yes gene_type:complete
MINPKEDIKRLESSKEFKEWKISHPKSYLSDFFCILDKESSEDNVWQIDFYNPEEDAITSFELPADKRKNCSLKEESSKVFKQDGEAVDKLSLRNVEWTDENVIHASKELMTEKHPGENIIKIILILQKNKDLRKVVWNLTFMTSGLNLFNAKVDAQNGKIIDYSMKSAMSLKKEILPGTGGKKEDGNPVAG